MEKEKNVGLSESSLGDLDNLLFDIPNFDRLKPILFEEPKIYGAPKGESRITIHALVDSWVEVRDKFDKILLTRVLRKGDRYHAPNEIGLTLVTGNAGGLKFTVDGQSVVSIGPLGTIRRNVKLNPTLLKDGIAHLSP